MTRQADLFIALSTTLKLEKVTIKNLTKNENSISRIFRIESDSSVNIINSYFDSINFSMAMVKNSALVIQNLEAHNITAISYLLDVYVSNGIVLNNFTVVNCQTIGLPGLFSFKKSTVESVRNSNFVESQLLVFIFSNSLVKQFDSNVLNGMNRGIQVTERSNATVNNNVFKNMKQNIKEGGVYYAEIKEAGSAIGKFTFFGK